MVEKMKCKNERKINWEQKGTLLKSERYLLLRKERYQIWSELKVNSWRETEIEIHILRNNQVERYKGNNIVWWKINLSEMSTTTK